MHATCFTPIVLDSPVDYAGVQASLAVLGLLRHLTTSTLCEQSVVSSLFHTAQPDEPAQFCKRGKATRYNNRPKWGAQSINIHSLCEARELVCVQAGLHPYVVFWPPEAMILTSAYSQSELRKLLVLYSELICVVLQFHMFLVWRSSKQSANIIVQNQHKVYEYAYSSNVLDADACWNIFQLAQSTVEGISGCTAPRW